MYIEFSSAPEAPSENDLLFINSTSVTLYLDGWPEEECTVLYFAVSYKHGQNWIPYGNGYLPATEITIGKLIPATVYTVRVIAYNTAGKTANDYVFATRSLNGGNTNYYKA